MQGGTLNCQSRRRGTANKTLFIPIRHRRLAGRDPTVPQSRNWSPKAKGIKTVCRDGLPEIWNPGQTTGVPVVYFIRFMVRLYLPFFVFFVVKGYLNAALDQFKTRNYF